MTAANEKRQLHGMMGMIRESNDLVAQLSARLRKAEEKLHIERENTQGMNDHLYNMKRVPTPIFCMLP